MSTPSNVAGLGERAAIDLIRRRLPAAPPWVVVGIGDDAAVAEPARNALDVFTTDALVEAWTQRAAAAYRDGRTTPYRQVKADFARIVKDFAALPVAAPARKKPITNA